MGYVYVCISMSMFDSCTRLRGVMEVLYSCCKYMYAFTKYFCRFIYYLGVLTGIQGSRALFGTGIVNRTLCYLEFPINEMVSLDRLLSFS